MSVCSARSGLLFFFCFGALFCFRCFNEETCISVPDAEGYVMVLQPEEPKISLSGIDHFARGAAEFESTEGVTLFPELRVVSTITREVEAEVEGEDEPTGTLLQQQERREREAK